MGKKKFRLCVTKVDYFSCYQLKYLREPDRKSAA